MQRPIRNRLILLGIWVAGAMVDRAWFALDHSIPAWDDAQHLNGALTYWQAIQSPHWFSRDWWVSLWLMSSKFPPLVYLSTAIILQIGGTGTSTAMLVHLFYSAILLISVYGLGCCLLSAEIGLWAAGLVMVMPGLYPWRWHFLLDHPTVAMVTLSFWALTVWWRTMDRGIVDHGILEQGADRAISHPTHGTDWVKAIGFGVAFGLGLLTKQTTLLFMLFPLLWTGGTALFQRRWNSFLQWIVGILTGILVCYPWYRTNWLLILTSGERATVVSAAAEGDPALNTMAAWVHYLQLLPGMLSYGLVLVAAIGFILHWQKLVKNLDQQPRPSQDLLIPVKALRQGDWDYWWRSARWLLVFLVGAYLLSSLNPNKDSRYITPMLPVVAIFLAQGLVLWPKSLRGFRLGTVGLAVLLMLNNLFPVLPQLSPPSAIHKAENWHHQDVLDTILRAEPYQIHTIGVLPSLSELNQRNVSYFGNLHNFQVHGRQVGASVAQVWQDSRSLAWYLVKTHAQGSIRKPQALNELNQAIANSPDLDLQEQWNLPDHSELQLYHRKIEPVNVQPLNRSVAKVALQAIQVPIVAMPGQPLSVKYEWVGSWEALQQGMVLLDWQRSPLLTVKSSAENLKSPPAPRWFHDHGIGLGLLRAEKVDLKAAFQVTEHLAMLPPQSAAGIYTLSATYLNRVTGDSYDLAVPLVQVKIDPKAASMDATELDPVTKFRIISGYFAQGMAVVDQVFDQVARMNLYDPTQDYLVQSQIALNYRLHQEPQNKEFAYGWALSQVLQRNVTGAIAGLQRVVALDPQNPNAYAYLAAVNLYDWRAAAGRRVLKQGLVLSPDLPVLRGLDGVADLMQGNWVGAWRAVKRFQGH